MLLALLTLLASLSNEISLHSSKSTTSPQDNNQQGKLHHSISSKLQEGAESLPATRMRSQSQNVAQERQETSPETNIGRNGVAARELLRLTSREQWYIMLRGQETEDQHEVGVQQVIQGPDHIEAVVDHHASSHDLRHVVLIRPISSEVALLLHVRHSTRSYQRQTRGEANLEHHKESSKMQRTTLS